MRIYDQEINKVDEPQAKPLIYAYMEAMMIMQLQELQVFDENY